MASREFRSERNQDMADTQRATPQGIRRGIPENPWIDDVGMLKDRKAHFEVDRLITCNCVGCQSSAKKHIEKSFKGTFGKDVAPDTEDSLYKLYEGFIQLTRNAKKEISPKNNPKTIFEE
jgi:hypothetical protein